MRISAQLAMWGCTVFSLVSLGFAAEGFLSLPAEIDPAEREATLSYAWFWTFLGVMAATIGAVYWRMLKKASQEAN